MELPVTSFEDEHMSRNYVDVESDEEEDFDNAHDDQEDDGGEDDEGLAIDDKTGEVIVLTPQLYKEWKNAATEKLSVDAIKKMVFALKSATFVADSESDLDIKRPKKIIKKFKGKVTQLKSKSQQHKFKQQVQDQMEYEESLFKIESAGMFRRVVVTSYSILPDLFYEYLLSGPSSDTSQRKKRVAKQLEKFEKGEKWLPFHSPYFNKIRTSIKSFLNTTLSFLPNISEQDTRQFILKKLEPMMLFLTSYASLAKKYLKAMLRIFATSDETSRILAFLCIRRMTFCLPYPFTELSLKGVYLTYVSCAKFVRPSSLAIIQFMCNCVTELYGSCLQSGLGAIQIDSSSHQNNLPSYAMCTYTGMFVYIRQLAMHLRSTIGTLTSKDAIRKVFNWQYVYSLRCWLNVFQQYPNEKLIQPLMYPLVQTAIGVISLSNSPRYFPLKLNLIRWTNDMCNSVSKHTFINTAPFLLQILHSDQVDYTKGEAKKFFKPLNVSTTLHFSKSVINTSQFRETIVGQTCELLISSFAPFSNSIAFPELALPAIMQLRKWNKNCPVVSYRKKIKSVIEQLEKNSEFIMSRRKQNNLSPSDVQAVENFADQVGNSTPLKQHLLRMHEKDAEKNKGVLAYQPQSEMRALKKQKKKAQQDDEDELVEDDDFLNSDVDEDDKMDVDKPKAKDNDESDFDDVDDDDEEVNFSHSDESESEGEEAVDRAMRDIALFQDQMAEEEVEKEEVAEKAKAEEKELRKPKPIEKPQPSQEARHYHSQQKRWRRLQGIRKKESKREKVITKHGKLKSLGRRKGT